MKADDNFFEFGMLMVLMQLAVIAFTIGCTSLETTAYRIIVTNNAFLRSVKAAHPECTAALGQGELCTSLNRAVSAKDFLIDVVEAYCAGPNFASGGACDAPKKGTPGYAQAAAKLKAAISIYNQAAADLKRVIK